jgi:hypothetical protein
MVRITSRAEFCFECNWKGVVMMCGKNNMTKDELKIFCKKHNISIGKYLKDHVEYKWSIFYQGIRKYHNVNEDEILDKIQKLIEINHLS